MTASRLRVRAYVSPVPAPRQTGVGRHTVEMLRQLDLRRDQVAVSLLVPSGALGSVRNSLPPALRSVRLEPLAGPEFLTRRLLIATTIVPADYGLGGDDWVYCPTMQPVYCGRARLAVTIHDSVSFERDGALGEPVGWRKALKDRLALNRTVRRAALVCVVSEHLKRRIQQIVPAADKARFVVVGNGAADVFYEPASDADVDILGSYALAGTRFVIAVGDMIYRKGADLLLQLASELRARKSGIEVAVAGRNRDERYCSDADLRNSKIRLLGHVPAERLAVLLRRSVALVLPSR
jgi:glycosyltransferase involved in cell wall biosynthesis